jgi:hypothetical protein
MTLAVMRVLVSSTGSVASSSQPVQAPPAAGDDFDAGVGVLDVERAAVGPQPCPLRGGGTVPPHDPIGSSVHVQLDQELDHACLVGHAVCRELNERIEVGVGVEDRLTFGPGCLVERSRSREQVLDVERREPDRHHSPFPTGTSASDRTPL